MKKSVSLNPGESKVVTFNYTPATAREYIVGADGLTGSFVAMEPPSAEFQVTGLSIEPPAVYVGETVSISVVVTNIGDAAGTYEVNCEVT